MLPTKVLAALLLGGGVSATIAGPPAASPRLEGFAYRAFGRAVAITGEFAFVGEPNTAFGGRGGGRGGAPPAPGVVHVYRLSAGAWKPLETLSGEGASEGDGFGSALAAEGNTLLVGQVRPAPIAQNFGGRGGRGGGAQQPAGPPPADTAIGTVQVFRRGADQKWAPAGSLSATQNAGAQFGSAIALSGSLALVGAPGEPSGGAVYVFQRAADGKWSANGALPAQG